MNILILGRAKTGTTVLAKTIQANLEKHRLWFEPRSLHHFFEARSNRVVTKVIFEHWDSRPYSRLALVSNELEMKFDKRVAIVRDPRDELVSRVFYMVRSAIVDGGVEADNIRQWIEFLQEKEKSPTSISFVQLLTRMKELLGVQLTLANSTSMNYFNFVEHHFKSGHIVRYENFIDGDRAELADYLGFKLDTIPAHDNLIDRTRRSATYGSWKTMFHESDLATYLDIHGAALTALGYADNELSPCPVLDPAHGSKYVVRIATAALIEKAARKSKDTILSAPILSSTRPNHDQYNQ